jgi:alpha-glucuronidase
MKSGRTLWEELCYRYYKGVDEIRMIQDKWNKLEKYIDVERFLPLPGGYEKPDKTLDYYKSLRFPHAPGN